jgi:CRP/FNR family transcriptional regulator, cyclic AMP receptor protein
MSSFILPRTGILSFMDDEAREQLTTYGTIATTQAGQVIIEENKPQRCLYIIISGVFNVTTATRGHEIHLDAAAAGDCVGEVALFEPGVASATVISRDSGRLWYMDEAHLQQYLLDWPFSGCALLLGVNTMLSRRLKRANGVIKSNSILPGFLSVRNRRRDSGVPIS